MTAVSASPRNLLPPWSALIAAVISRCLSLHILITLDKGRGGINDCVRIKKRSIPGRVAACATPDLWWDPTRKPLWAHPSCLSSPQERPQSHCPASSRNQFRYLLLFQSGTCSGGEGVIRNKHVQFQHQNRNRKLNKSVPQHITPTSTKLLIYPTKEPHKTSHLDAPAPPALPPPLPPPPSRTTVVSISLRGWRKSAWVLSRFHARRERTLHRRELSFWERSFNIF